MDRIRGIYVIDLYAGRLQTTDPGLEYVLIIIEGYRIFIHDSLLSAQLSLPRSLLHPSRVQLHTFFLLFRRAASWLLHLSSSTTVSLLTWQRPAGCRRTA